MSSEPVGFLSYVRDDDKHERGRLSDLAKRLSGEVQIQTGEKFHIFQDRNDIEWGQQWKVRLEDSLDEVTFLVPIITPGFFKSPACRTELERFLKREKNLKRSDLILPIYYVNYPILNDEEKRKADPLATVIAERQYADYRELRFEPLTSPEVSKLLAKMATQIVEALERDQPTRNRAKAKRTARRKIRGRAPKPDGSKQEESSVQSAKTARGPSGKNEQATLVVDALHRGDHSTLTAALAAAKAGDRILVRPGLYREGVIIDKPVEIIGDGDLGEVVIEASGSDVVLFRANMGRISNLTLRQAGEGKWFAVDISQGRLDLEACDITSMSLACVGIHGGADPRLRRNSIHHATQSGVYIYDDGRGTLEDNDIFANALPGVAIKTGGNPIVRRNRIHDGRQSGVHVYEKGLGTLEDNEITANAYAGVSITTGGNSTLRRNRVSKNGLYAIRISEGGSGVFEDNDLRENTLGPWSISPDSEKSLTRSGNQE